mmetsp:Transcript_97181/g.272009  ORF Transcript_97181/g.272009 Transcript_97181/m.272009 type:complete len:249 (-) Transcript_97181:1240-1986(-)
MSMVHARRGNCKSRSWTMFLRARGMASWTMFLCCWATSSSTATQSDEHLDTSANMPSISGAASAPRMCCMLSAATRPLPSLSKRLNASFKMSMLTSPASENAAAATKSEYRSSGLPSSPLQEMPNMASLSQTLETSSSGSETLSAERRSSTRTEPLPVASRRRKSRRAGSSEGPSTEKAARRRQARRAAGSSAKRLSAAAVWAPSKRPGCEVSLAAPGASTASASLSHGCCDAPRAEGRSSGLGAKHF